MKTLTKLHLKNFPLLKTETNLAKKCFSENDMDFSAEVLEGKIIDKQIKYNPAWRINGWNMGHPYGTSIFARTWNPEISLSLGSSTVSVLDVHYFKKSKAGMIKDFLSYKISMPKDTINPRNSKI